MASVVRTTHRPLLCLLAVLFGHGCGGGGGGGGAPAIDAPAPDFDASLPGNVRVFLESGTPLQNILDNLRRRPNPAQRARILVIDTNTADADPSQRRHASNTIGVLRVSSIETAVTIEYCDIRGASFDNVRACLDYYSMEENLPKVINYSRVLPRDPHLEREHLPDDALLVVAAGQIGSNPNTRREFIGALLQTGRVLVVSGENDAGTGLQQGAFECGQSQVYCLLAPYTVSTSAGTISGTSLSAPMVSGLAGTVRAYWPMLSAVQTADLILGCVRQADDPTEDTRRDTGRGLLSHLDVACILNPVGDLRLRGLTTGAGGLRGSLLSAGSFSLPTLTAYDEYGRDYPLRPAQATPPGRNTFLEGLFDAAAQVYSRPGGQLARGLVEAGAGRLYWHSPHAHSRVFHHLYQAAGAEALTIGTLRPLGPTRLTTGVTLERHSFAGGELIGTGQLRIGDSLGWFAGLFMPMHSGAWEFDLQLGVMQAHMLRPADRSTLRALSARTAGINFGAYWQPMPKLRLGLRAGCHNGLDGSARLGGRRLPLLANSACRGELQFSLY